MHLTLHITTGCNLNCKYCYSPPVSGYSMTEDTARQAVDFGTKLNPENLGVIFFGGEPLLHKDLIKSTVEYCKSLESKYGYRYHFKITTNGTLLDEDFLNYAKTSRIAIAISCDGTREANDKNRLQKYSCGSFDLIEDKMALLLKYQPYSHVLMTTTPDTVQYYFASFKYLIEAGFRYIVSSLDYSGNWEDRHLKIYQEQLEKIAVLYEELTLKEHKFYFSPFEMKLASYIRTEDIYCQKCILGKKQLSVAFDGTIYPCVQFVQDGRSNRSFAIGTVWDGLDQEKADALYQESLRENDLCNVCEVQDRCNHNCSCLNWQTTGYINQISPFLCETERIQLNISDRLGNRLFKSNSAMFIQKHYNVVYPILSMLEDMHQ